MGDEETHNGAGEGEMHKVRTERSKYLNIFVDLNIFCQIFDIRV